MGNYEDMRKVTFKYKTEDNIAYILNGAHMGVIHAVFYDMGRDEVYYSIKGNSVRIPERDIYPSMDELLKNFK